MIDTKLSARSRGRPRSFDVEGALDRAQALFHEKGYDAVGVAALTEALGISPPSFYAAFGSKAELFDRVLARYASCALPLDTILRTGRDPAEGLTDLLMTAADIYARDPAAPGCMVLESVRAAPGDCSAQAARPYRLGTHARVSAFIAETMPDQAEGLADMIDVLLSGLSASAREGWEQDRIRAVASRAALAIRHQLVAE